MPTPIDAAMRLEAEGATGTKDHDASRLPKRAVVISNCQCLPIASWLTTFSSATVFDFWGVHIIPAGQQEAEIDAFVQRARSDYELILTIPLSDDYLGLSTERIAGTFAGIPVRRISNIYFSGLHPDLTYLGGLGTRVMGPLGDYHSKLAIHGFLKGLSVPDTMALFCTRSYEMLGYYDEYAQSMSTLAERDRIVDVPVTRILDEKLRSALCLFSVNHPTPALLSAYCYEVTRYLEDNGFGQYSGMPPDPSMCGESLANSAIFPIYPEVAAHHGVPSFGSYSFKPEGARVNALDLFTFLTREFDTFSEVRRGRIGGLPCRSGSHSAVFSALDRLVR